MDPLNVAVAYHIIQDLEEAEELAFVPGRRFADRADKDPFTELSERQFISYFRLSKAMVNHLVDIVTPFMPNASRPCRLTNQKKVLTALRFLGSGSYQGISGSDAYVYVSQSSVSQCINQVCSALNEPAILNEWIRFPRNIAELQNVRTRFFNQHQFPGVIGCIDCTHVAIIAPPENDPEHPEHIYVNRKNYHSINVQLICDESLTIINVNASFPGSAHDARIWRESPISHIVEQIYRQNPNELFYLLGDSGYPLRPWLQTPIRDPEPDSPQERYNNKLTSVRSIIERCNGVLKNRFRCLLKHRVLHYRPTTASKIINACVILHNMCIQNNLPEVEEDADVLGGNLGMYEPPPNQDLRGIANQDLQAGRQVQLTIINNYFN